MVMASRFWRVKMMAAASVAALLAACATAPPLTPEQLEAQAWSGAQSQDTPFAYEDYLRLYGDWPNADGARYRIESLMREERVTVRSTILWCTGFRIIWPMPTSYRPKGWPWRSATPGASISAARPKLSWA
jgi:hypothetical protein